jgi:hypothetical protein
MARTQLRKRERNRSDAKIMLKISREMFAAAKRESTISTRVAVVLAQNAIIRVCDALCVNELGYYIQGQSHNDAVELLKKLRDGKKLAMTLSNALSDKTTVGYDIAEVSETRLTKVLRACENLINEADFRIGKPK